MTLYGGRRPDVTRSYPDASPQAILAPWWEEDSDKETVRVGSLIWAYPPYPEQNPWVLRTEGRVEPTEHRTANYRVFPLTPGAQLTTPQVLPVAAFPEHPGEFRLLVRCKTRPCLVIGFSAPEVATAFTKKHAEWQTRPVLLVAPYYGIKSGSGGRVGWNDQFVERIRRCQYPQYMWDWLPVKPAPTASILRLDHVHAVPMQPHGFKLCGYHLSADATRLLQEWVHWLWDGSIKRDGILELLRDGLFVEEPST